MHRSQGRPARGTKHQRTRRRAARPTVDEVVAPLLLRLDEQQELLRDLKAVLDVQFKRTAAIQAQLDRLVAPHKNAA